MLVSLLFVMICKETRKFDYTTDGDCWNNSAYLVCSSNDEDPAEDKALSQNVSHEAVPKGPEAVRPHTDTEETQKTHPPLTGSIKTPLQSGQTKQRP